MTIRASNQSLRELRQSRNDSFRLEDLLTRRPVSVANGVMDFSSAPANDYCENFGEQWNRFRRIQLDSVSSKSISRDRFLAETGWTAEEVKGKVLLDAGCGAGRFAEVALECGARVVAVDLSVAAFACRKTLERFDPDDYLVLRADLFDLPLRENVFDGIYSLGVLHHTPDPLGAIDQLVRFLKPSARLATWIYERRSPDIRWLQPRTALRVATRSLSTERKLKVSRIITAVFFPLGWVLSWFGRVGEKASHFLPYAARHHHARGDLRLQWDYCVMDTFDWYGPVYERPQRERDLIKAMKQAGLVNVHRWPARGMAVTGEGPPETMPRVSAVVLNWKNFEDSKRCLHSLEQSGYSNLRPIAVDNGSADGSAERLQEELPHLTFLLNSTNLGFARGCNVGIREALKDPECAYVLLLNNDATILEGTLETAVCFAEANPAVGAISGKILSSRDSSRIWYAGGHLDRWRGQAIVRGFGEVDRGQYESRCEVGFVTGAMMLVRREVLEKVSLLPEEYFFGVEEWDYSLRIKKAGYQLYYLPDFISHHRADGSHWNYDPKFVYNSYRNKLIFQEQNLPSIIFAIWRRAFALYGRHIARRARERLIRRHRFELERPVDLDDLDFALTRALSDHGQGVLSEQALTAFEEELNARKRVL